MKIKIGREQGQARLRLLCNGRETFYGEKGSVDLSVSKEHCEIDIEPNGKVTIVNLNPDNETFVNGKSIIKKQVDQMSIESIGLGSNGYSFALPVIVRALGLKETYSIGHLKSIIESYKDAKLAIQIKNGRQNAMRGLTPVFGLLGGLLAFMGGPGILFSVISLLACCYFCYKGYIDASANPKKVQELDNKFHKECVCPNPSCGHFLHGEYEDILRAGMCPWCKSKFKE